MGPGSGGRAQEGGLPAPYKGRAAFQPIKKRRLQRRPGPGPGPCCGGEDGAGRGERPERAAGSTEPAGRRPLPARAAAASVSSRRSWARDAPRPQPAARPDPGGRTGWPRAAPREAAASCLPTLPSDLLSSAFHTARSGDQQIKTNHHYIASKSIFLHPRRFRLTRGHFKPREAGAKRPQRVPPRRPRTRLPRPLRCSARSPVIVPQRTFKTARRGSL